MAVFIEIRKVSEDAETAVFNFSLTTGSSGTLILRKLTGQVEQLRPIPGDSPEKGLFARAAHKVRTHWKTGVLPDLINWAS